MKCEGLLTHPILSGFWAMSWMAISPGLQNTNLNPYLTSLLNKARGSVQGSFHPHVIITTVPWSRSNSGGKECKCRPVLTLKLCFQCFKCLEFLSSCCLGFILFSVSYVLKHNIPAIQVCNPPCDPMIEDWLERTDERTNERTNDLLVFREYNYLLI